MRRVLTLTLALAALPAHAAIIPGGPSPGPEWIELRIGGNFDLGGVHGAVINVFNSVGDVRRMTQTADPAEYHQLWVERDTIDRLRFTNSVRFSIGDARHGRQSHDGSPYVAASVWSMTAGPVVDVGGTLFHRWEYSIDGGEPFTVDAALVPEPASITLALAGVVCAMRRRRR